MRLELTEILACPRCGPRHGLIAFVDRMVDRRIQAGHLDCPICEERHEVRDGTVYLGGEDEAEGSEEGAAEPAARSVRSAESAASAASESSESASVAAALLGAPGGSETLLLAGGAESLAPAVADLRPEASVVTYGAVPAPGPVHVRVHAIVPAAPDNLPLRSAVLDGAVLRGGDCGPMLAEVTRALRAGARLVVLDPAEALIADAAQAALTELASDPRAWVGVRS